MKHNISIILPAKNEADNLRKLLPAVRRLYPDVEIIVVNDGSDDDTAAAATEVEGVVCVSHPVSIGNGGAIKSGTRKALGEVLVFMDADGQHNPEDIDRLLSLIDEGYDMVVGARSNSSQASIVRSIANNIFNKLASLMTGFEIEDLTSGFRAVRRSRFLSILYLLPNKFSYPTTSTIAFFRSGYFVGYIPIEAGQRGGVSHIRIVRDGIRFLIIILKIGVLYSPMRLFLPVSAVLFLLATGYYGFTYMTDKRFTNMGMLLYMSSLSTFLIGIVAEQVSALHYRDSEKQ